MARVRGRDVPTKEAVQRSVRFSGFARKVRTGLTGRVLVGLCDRTGSGPGGSAPLPTQSAGTLVFHETEVLGRHPGNPDVLELFHVADESILILDAVGASGLYP